MGIDWVTLLFRPPDIHVVVDGRIFYRGFFFFLSFFLLFLFFRPLISELSERNSTISGHMDGSTRDDQKVLQFDTLNKYFYC